MEDRRINAEEARRIKLETEMIGAEFDGDREVLYEYFLQNVQNEAMLETKEICRADISIAVGIAIRKSGIVEKLGIEENSDEHINFLMFCANCAESIADILFDTKTLNEKEARK